MMIARKMAKLMMNYVIYCIDWCLYEDTIEKKSPG